MSYQPIDQPYRPSNRVAAQPLGLGGADIVISLILGLLIAVVYQAPLQGAMSFATFITSDAIARYFFFKLHL